jgi:hypothetical protein
MTDNPRTKPRTWSALLVPYQLLIMEKIDSAVLTQNRESTNCVVTAVDVLIHGSTQPAAIVYGIKLKAGKECRFSAGLVRQIRHQQ